MPEKELSGKVAIVTGAGGEIATQISLQLAAAGAAVVCNHRGDQDRGAAERVATAIVDAGGRSTVVSADISDETQVSELFRIAKATFGRIDIVINNAAIGAFSPIVDLTEELVDKAIEVNLKGTIRVCRYAATMLSDSGRIINISSSSTAEAIPGYGLYTAAKAGVEQFSRVLSKELGRRHVTVNVVSPGATDTEAFRAAKTDEQIETFRATTPLGRIGTPRDIAAVVTFLCTDRGEWINGQNIRVNGGQA